MSSITKRSHFPPISSAVSADKEARRGTCPGAEAQAPTGPTRGSLNPRFCTCEVGQQFGSIIPHSHPLGPEVMFWPQKGDRVGGAAPGTDSHPPVRGPGTSPQGVNTKPQTASTGSGQVSHWQKESFPTPELWAAQLSRNSGPGPPTAPRGAAGPTQSLAARPPRLLPRLPPGDSAVDVPRSLSPRPHLPGSPLAEDTVCPDAKGGGRCEQEKRQKTACKENTSKCICLRLGPELPLPPKESCGPSTRGAPPRPISERAPYQCDSH